MNDKKNFMNFNITRRDFVRSGGAVVAGSAASAAFGAFFPIKSAEAMPLPGKWDSSTDIVVLGSGAAGLCAAIAAIKSGAKVIVLEKEPVTGGSSAICGGQFAAAPTSMQKEKGIKDSTDLFFNDLMNIGKRKNDPKLVRTFVDESNESFEMLKSLGAEFKTINIFAGFSVPRSHYVNPADALKRLKNEAIRLGATIKTNTSGKRLFADSHGRIVGVKAVTKQGKEFTIKARKAVILATGGFGRNAEMLEEFSNMPLGFCIPINGPGSMGDGHKMAMEYGAGTKHISLGIGPSCPTDVKTQFITMPHYQGAVCLNKEGKRFVNESISYLDVAKAALEQPEALIIQIADANVYEAAMKDALSNKGAPQKAPTLEQLAPLVGLDPKVLCDAINTYNRNIDSGKDPDFKRTTLVGISGKPFRIETAPFYGFLTKPAIISNKGGLKVNTKTQVLKIYGEIIPGLYAPGEIMGGFHGDGYHTGSAFAKAFTFGRIAGQNAALEKSWS